MELDLECVSSFLTLVEEEHYGRAAARLHVNSPALTKRIQRLERQVGVALVEHRAPGGFALTVAGRRFRHHAPQLLLQARIARNAARESSKGIIRLGVPGRIGDSPDGEGLKMLAALFHETGRETRLICIPVPYPLMNESLLQQRVDVAWTTAGCEHVDLDPVPLTKMWRVGIVSARHHLADAVAVDVADFANQPLLHNPDIHPGMMSWGVLEDYRPLSAARLVTTRASDSTGVFLDVADELGVAAMPAAFKPRALEAGLRVLSIVGLMPTEIHAVRRRHDTRSVVLDLIHCLGKVATQIPYA